MLLGRLGGNGFLPSDDTLHVYTLRLVVIASSLFVTAQAVPRCDVLVKEPYARYHSCNFGVSTTSARPNTLPLPGRTYIQIPYSQRLRANSLYVLCVGVLYAPNVFQLLHTHS